jgi:hypothetical protein
MFLRKADYWSKVEKDKENAKQENRQDQSDRWETENRDKYRTFVPSPEGVLLQDNDFDSRQDAGAILEVDGPSNELNY